MTIGSTERSRRSARPARRDFDLWLLVKALVLVVVAVLLYTGCSVMMPGASSSGTSDGTGTGPGVTDDAVKVVFVGTDLSKTAKLTGFNDVDTGDPKKQVAALASYINAHGGIAGRKLNAVYRNYEASNDSPAAETTLCNQITQDDQAFAVVLTGQLQSNARPCYAQRHTLMLDMTLIANNTKTFDSLSPYLWTASFPEHDAFAKSFVKVLGDQGFFTGRSKAGLVAADTPADRAVYSSVVEPALKKLGVTGTVEWIDTTDLGTLNTGLNNAATNFRSKSIDRVFFLGGARIAPFFMTTATALNFTARYGISTFDSPSFMVENPSTIQVSSLAGMIGIGFAPGYDVTDSQQPFPSSAAEKNCESIYKASGITFKTRENSRVAFAYCDAAVMLQDAAKDLGANLNATAWAKAAHALGTTFQTATGFGGQLGANQYAAASGYKVLGYDTACSCFTYRGDVVPLGQ